MPQSVTFLGLKFPGFWTQKISLQSNDVTDQLNYIYAISVAIFQGNDTILVCCAS